MLYDKQNKAVFDNAQRAYDNMEPAENKFNLAKCDNCGDHYDADNFPTEICYKCYDFWKTEERQSLLKKLLNIFKRVI